MKATYFKHQLQFKRPSGTSRGVLTYKETWFIQLENTTRIGIGECGMFKGLSIDDRQDFEAKLAWTCEHINLGLDVLLAELIEFPSIQFGLEMAFLSVSHQNQFELYQHLSLWKFHKMKNVVNTNVIIKCVLLRYRVIS